MDLSPTSQARVFVGTILGTAICIAVAVFVDSFSFQGMTEAQIATSLRNDILIPLFLGGIFFYFLLGKMRALAIAQLELQRLASTDSLTAVLNRGAFTALVDAYLTDICRSNPPQGALLLVDADYFKKINDTYGHQTGDEALKRIASTISVSIGTHDLVGRVGGEEFGVFLPGLAIDKAKGVAERIRSEIHQHVIKPTGNLERLSVSIGGVAFTSGASFSRLFGEADKNLYAAKATGRNKVVLGFATSI